MTASTNTTSHPPDFRLTIERRCLLAALAASDPQHHRPFLRCIHFETTPHKNRPVRIIATTGHLLLVIDSPGDARLMDPRIQNHVSAQALTALRLSKAKNRLSHTISIDCAAGRMELTEHGEDPAGPQKAHAVEPKQAWDHSPEQRMMEWRNLLPYQSDEAGNWELLRIEAQNCRITAADLKIIAAAADLLGAAGLRLTHLPAVGTGDGKGQGKIIDDPDRRLVKVEFDAGADHRWGASALIVDTVLGGWPRGPEFRGAF